MTLKNLCKFFLLGIFCFSNCIKAFGQVDSIQIFKNQIKDFKQQPNFTENSTQYVDLLNGLAYQLRYTAKDSINILAQKALEISGAIDYKEGELEALSNFSMFHLFKGEMEKAIDFGNKAIADIHLSEYAQTEMKVHNQLGQAYFSQQNYPLTYTHFLHALAIGERKKDDFYVFRMNMNLGTMFNLLEDFDEAHGYYASAKEAAQKLQNGSMIAMISSNLAYLYIQQDKFQEAKSLLQNSITYFKKHNDELWLAFSYGTYGQLLLKTGNYQMAKSNYTKALNSHNSVNDIKGKADIYFGLAKANYKLNNIDTSEDYAYKSLDLYKSFKLNTGLEKVYRLLYEINKQQGNIGKSLEYLEMTEKLANDISKEKNRRNLTMVNAKLNLEKEKEDLKAKSSLELEQQRKYVRWALIALAILFIIVLIILSINKREKLLNKQLESQAVALNENQKELTTINRNQDRLFSIIGHDLRGPIISLKELLKFYLEDPEGKVYFEKFAPQLKEELEQVQFTMDNLLHWGKAQMNGNQINPETVQVKPELDIILQLYKNELQKKSIKLITGIKEVHTAFVDWDHFNIIFRNLISNAIKFTPNNGEIKILTEQIDDSLKIYVIDNGVGMSKDAIQNIFNDNEHFTTYGTNREKGTGLGLRLVREMVLANNGKIQVESTLDQGSIFSVELPMKKI
ncbi:Signal transduction histidine kinase [Maribacter sedimenticola]|uniref:histidine kinase n=1 Tax=Maribacter sedimenticola TaxID=228956 RepID=A0ABY1SHU8_9FLAO|nr:tetratricopeptide repeat-containing sensor histidine kinase [Maribacter sedimenticola]SNR48427.1 Signal transduction histidine kinase [Maribacter sedimenticola]